MRYSKFSNSKHMLKNEETVLWKIKYFFKIPFVWKSNYVNWFPLILTGWLYPKNKLEFLKTQLQYRKPSKSDCNISDIQIYMGSLGYDVLDLWCFKVTMQPIWIIRKSLFWLMTNISVVIKKFMHKLVHNFGGRECIVMWGLTEEEERLIFCCMLLKSWYV